MVGGGTAAASAQDDRPGDRLVEGHFHGVRVGAQEVRLQAALERVAPSRLAIIEILQGGIHPPDECHEIIGGELDPVAENGLGIDLLGSEASLASRACHGHRPITMSRLEEDGLAGRSDAIED